MEDLENANLRASKAEKAFYKLESTLSTLDQGKTLIRSMSINSTSDASVNGTSSSNNNAVSSSEVEDLKSALKQSQVELQRVTEERTKLAIAAKKNHAEPAAELQVVSSPWYIKLKELSKSQSTKLLQLEAQVQAISAVNEFKLSQANEELVSAKRFHSQIQNSLNNEIVSLKSQLDSLRNELEERQFYIEKNSIKPVVFNNSLDLNDLFEVQVFCFSITFFIN